MSVLKGSSFFLVLSSSIIVLLGFHTPGIAGQGEQFPIRLQPELDSINIDEYLANKNLMDQQINCVLHNGLCDEVGRWVKPRAAVAFLGQCLECTPLQKVNMQKIMQHMQIHYPIEYRLAVAQFLLRAGINAMQLPLQ